MFRRKDVTDGDLRAIRAVAGAIKDIYRIGDAQRSALDLASDEEQMAEVDRVVGEQQE